ncbi:MAG: 1,2-phenylacetyl-CoA epoxidase subunit PaaD [Nitriliruptorales bacterium]
MTARPSPADPALRDAARDLTSEVRRAVESVPDPELPPVTVGNLGMLHELHVDEAGHVEVELLPTFSGCPATDVIREDVEDVVARIPGVTDVEVRFRFDPPWTPERIDADGRERLREFGITPPGEVVEALEGLSERLQLPLQPVTLRPCPYCGSEDTISDSDFGPTPCRSVHFCRECMQPFEAFKAL